MDFVFELFVIVAMLMVIVSLVPGLRQAIAAIGAGAKPERRGGYEATDVTFVSPMGIKLTNIEPRDQVKLYAAGWLPEGHPDAGATGKAVAKFRTSPGHRKFGILRASRDGVALPSWREDAPDAPAFMRSSLTDVLQGEHPGLVGSGIERSILGDH